jgi:DNA-binding response OmpR family regulator
VLVVDDDVTARTLSKALLEMEGCRVVEAEDGVEALDVVERSDALPDLVILDLTMPRMDGEETLRRLRALIPAADLPVIVLTGSRDTETEVRLVEAGADDYVRKPVEPRLFLSRVRAALRRVRA